MGLIVSDDHSTEHTAPGGVLYALPFDGILAELRGCSWGDDGTVDSCDFLVIDGDTPGVVLHLRTDDPEINERPITLVSLPDDITAAIAALPDDDDATRAAAIRALLDETAP